MSLIRAENPRSSTIKHCHSLHESPKSHLVHPKKSDAEIFIRFYSVKWNDGRLLKLNTDA